MGLFSGICSVVASVCSAVGSAVGGLATGLAKLNPYLAAISTIVQVVGTLLGVLNKGENMDEMGQKAMQTDKKPEDFDAYSDYIDHLRNDVVLDKKEFEELSDIEKMGRSILGTAITIKGVEEKKGFDIPLAAWVVMAKMGMNEKNGSEIDTVLEAFKGNYDNLSKYTEGELNAKKEIEVRDDLYEVYKEIEPNASDKEIKEKVLNMGG